MIMTFICDLCSAAMVARSVLSAESPFRGIILIIALVPDR
jgi:hypothetical protein